MSNYRSRLDEAWESYGAGRMTEAALLFRRAAECAREMGDTKTDFQATVWVALCIASSGSAPDAMAVLLHAVSMERDLGYVYADWLARKLFIDITLRTRPELDRIRHLLDDLRSYGVSCDPPKGDLPKIEANLHIARYEWSAAIIAFEKAWNDYDDRGFFKSNKAFGAARSCLRLGKTSAFAEWSKAMSTCDEDYPVFGAGRAELAVRLALFEGKVYSELVALLRTYSDRVALVTDDETVAAMRNLAVRVYLLDVAGGDPAADFHPARQELLRRSNSRYDLLLRYDDLLLRLDYRLACLRYVAGFPCVDDFYYTSDQNVVIQVNPSETTLFSRRLKQAYLAAQRALGFAEKLDELLECDGRQREVRDRMKRIEEIKSLLVLAL